MKLKHKLFFAGIMLVAGLGISSAQVVGLPARASNGTGLSAVTGIAPVRVTGGSAISCDPANGDGGGCLTNGAQFIAGYKTFEDNVAAPIFESPPSLSGYYRSHLAAGSSGNDFDIFTENIRSDGQLLSINNQYSPMWYVTFEGQTVQAGGLNLYGTIYQSKTNTVSLKSAIGGELQVAGQLPDYYDGRHGVLNVTNTNETRGGWILQLSKHKAPYDNTSTVLAVDFEGGITGSYAAYQTNTLAQCGGGEQTNPTQSDGGGIGIGDGGFGYAAESAIMYVVDKHIWCWCLPSAGDGGAVGTTGDGWLRMHDNLPCST